MRVGYDSIKGTLSAFSKRMVMGTALLVLPLTARLEKSASAKSIPTQAPVQPVKPDPRTTRLQRFFSSLHCPVSNLAQDFIEAADDNRLDWRLLPSISVIESGGGKAYRNNNIFGWNNGLQPFPSIRAGLNLVAFKLGHSALYRNRDVVGKLRLYNPDETYVSKVVGVMNQISPVAELNSVRHLVRRQNEYVYVSN